MKPCTFCPRLNQYICKEEDHCGLCPRGQQQTKEETEEEDNED